MSRWYIIHAYSGFENKVKDQILADATRMSCKARTTAARGSTSPDSQRYTVRAEKPVSLAISSILRPTL